MPLRLFENRVDRDCIGIRSSDSGDFTHCSSVAIATIARYLVLMEYRATVRCFVELQEIELALRNMTKVHVEMRSFGLSTHYVSEKLCNV